APAAAADPPAFPGADGFGAAATGGRGGRVVYVTTLAANGPGSLQAALDMTGPRYVLFKVSGLVDAQVHLTHGDVTIAGQTSPGGITLRGLITDEAPFLDQDVRAPDRFAENWILRHVRLRPGADGPADDGLRLRYTRNAVVDHVSIGNAVDEAVEISYSSRITIQDSILAETIGSHAFYGGVLMNYSNPAFGFPLDRISLSRNLFARIQGRLPEMSRESPAAARTTLSAQVTSNLYWDPTFYVAIAPDTNVVTDGAGRPYPLFYRLALVDNAFVTRPAFPYAMFGDGVLRASSAARNRILLAGNRLSTRPELSGTDLFYCCNDFAQFGPDRSPIRAKLVPSLAGFPRVARKAPDALPAYVVGNVGAFPRDPMDRRLVGAVAAGKIDPRRTDRNPVGDALLPAFDGAPPPPPRDRDGDGMPDDWEVAHGLPPDRAGANARTLSAAGWTDLEVYLSELAALRVSGR
ncbi:hypothetical protein, partial [Oharaeibacter diazotrophicus]